MSSYVHGKIESIDSYVNFDSDRLSYIIGNNSIEANKKIRDIFKVDLYMPATGDLIADPRDKKEKSDIKLVTGIYNYAQQITHRLMTEKGTHPIDRNLGIAWSSYLGSYLSKSSVKIRLSREIEEEMLKDYRTDEVISISVEFEDQNVVRADVSLKPVLVDFDISLGVRQKFI